MWVDGDRHSNIAFMGLVFIIHVLFGFFQIKKAVGFFFLFLKLWKVFSVGAASNLCLSQSES